MLARTAHLHSRLAAPLLVAALLPHCAPSLSRISGRRPDLFEKESDHLVGQGRDLTPQPAPALFVREKQPVIKEKAEPNDTGSLFNPEDERNYLFVTTGPLNVGRFLTIAVAPLHSSEKAKGSKDKPDKAGKGKDAKSKDGKAEGGKDKDKGGGDELEAELLKALPDLTPATPGEMPLLKNFKMQIVHRFDNGDVLVMMQRESQRDDHLNEVAVKARIPYDRLSSGDELTTDDLLAVEMSESRDGEATDRHSTGWEDDYSLRLSGFSEAKSKMAMELGDQRKQLQEANGKLEDKIKTFGEERRQFAKQRDDLMQRKADNESKLQTLQDQVSDQASTIEAQQQKIQDLGGGDAGTAPAGGAKPKAPAKAPNKGPANAPPATPANG